MTDLLQNCISCMLTKPNRCTGVQFHQITVHLCRIRLNASAQTRRTSVGQYKNSEFIISRKKMLMKKIRYIVSRWFGHFIRVANCTLCAGWHWTTPLGGDNCMVSVSGLLLSFSVKRSVVKECNAMPLRDNTDGAAVRLRTLENTLVLETNKHMQCHSEIIPMVLRCV